MPSSARISTASSPIGTAAPNGFSAIPRKRRSESRLRLIPEERLKEEADILRCLRSGQHVEHFETVRRRKNGTPIEISVAISPVKNSSGEVVGASKTARDITERKRRDEQIVVLAREAEHRSKNLLATEQATVRLTQADTAADLKEAYSWPNPGAGSRPRAIRRNEMGGSGPEKPGLARAFAILPGRREARGYRGGQCNAPTRRRPGNRGLPTRIGDERCQVRRLVGARRRVRVETDGLYSTGRRSADQALPNPHTGVSGCKSWGG